MKIKKPLIVFCGVALLFGAFTLGTVVERQMFDARATIDFLERNTSYKFINPLLFCQDQNLDNLGANEIEDSVGAYINQQKRAGSVIDAAFYFRDLNGGPWALVNPDFRSIPASLLKVPLAISVYQRAEQKPGFLSTKIELATSSVNVNKNEHFQPAERLEYGRVYTIEDVVKYMLKDSDNAALYLLANLFTVNDLQDSYTHLGITPPEGGGQQYTMTVKTYSSFFRILYNGTYLTQDNSERLLSVLSQSTFTQGLVAGLPSGMLVAHKFGEMASSDGTLQLHDCGIVYKPKQPYLICVMTKGTDYDALASVISHISSMVYSTLDSAR